MMCSECQQQPCRHSKPLPFGQPANGPRRSMFDAHPQPEVHAHHQPARLGGVVNAFRRPPATVVAPRRTMRQQAGIALLKGGGRGALGLLKLLLWHAPRWSMTYRRRVWPGLAAGAVQTSSWLLSLVDKGIGPAVLMVLAVGAGLAAWIQRSETNRPRPAWSWQVDKPADLWKWGSLWWPAISWAAGSTCLILGTLFGAGPPLPGILAVWAVATGVPWWWHIRKRTAPPLDANLFTWMSDVATPEGALPGTWLENYDVKPGINWSALIMLPGRMTTVQATSLDVRRLIAKAYRVPLSSVVIEPGFHGEEDRVRLLILSGENPLQTPQLFHKPSLDLATGWVTIGIRPDGTLARWRFFIPGSGACSGMIFGAPGAGKSGLLNVLLTESRHSGNMVTWLGDYQDGESVPDHQDHVDRFAGKLPEIRRMLQEAERIMVDRAARNKKTYWIDDKGRRRRGKGFHKATPENPQLNVFLDEAPDIMADPECRRIIKAIGRKGRKVGVAVIIIAQVPALTEMGGDGTLRSVIASFNVVAFRTGDPQSKQMGASNLPVDPYTLPKTWPDGTSTAGLGYVVDDDASMSYMRAMYVEDPFAWATSGQPCALPAADADAAGEDYYSWRERTEREEDHIESTPAQLRLIHGSAGLTLAEQAQVAAQAKSPELADATIGARALEVLARRGNATTGVIAKELNAPKGSVSQALRRMELLNPPKVIGQSTGNLPGTWCLAEAGAEDYLEAAS